MKKARKVNGIVAGQTVFVEPVGDFEQLQIRAFGCGMTQRRSQILMW